MTLIVSAQIYYQSILYELWTFTFCPLSYLEKEALWFINVTDNLDLIIELVDNVQSITNSKDEEMRKQNKHTAKKKARLDNRCIFMQAAPTGFPVFLSSCPIFISQPGSSALLSSCPGSPTSLLPLFTCPETPTALSSYLLPALVPGSSALLFFLLILSPTPSHLASTALKTFQ